jgi:hypothetical protein
MRGSTRGVRYGTPKGAEFNRDANEFAIAWKSQGSGEGMEALQEV